MSTYSSSVISSDCSTNATIQAFYGQLEAQIVTAWGWTVEADMGDTDPTTLTAPGTNADAGYRIYKTGDAGTAYYLKVIFGRAGGTGPRIKIKTGTGSDGAGTLTGQLSTEQTLAITNASTSPYLMSGTAGRFSMTYNANATGGIGFAVGRTCDTTGADTNDGVELFGCAPAYSAQLIPFSGTVGAAYTVIPANWPAVTPVTNGSATFVSVPQLFAEALVASPTRLALIHDNSSFTAGNTTAVTVYGASHTYQILAPTSAAAYGSSRAMFLYE